MTNNRSRILRTLKLFEKKVKKSIESRTLFDITVNTTSIERVDLNNFLAWYYTQTVVIKDYKEFCKNYVMTQVKPI